MQIISFVGSIILLAIILLLVVFFIFDLLFSILVIKIPSLSSRPSVIKKIIEEPFFKNIFAEGKKFYDFGCGNGKTLFALTKNFPIKSVGYEMNPAAFLTALTKRIFSSKRVRKNSKLVLGDFFKADFGDADIIYIYLFPKIVAKVESKILKECKEGTYIICNTFDLTHIKPIHVYSFGKGNLNSIFVYRK